MELIDYDQYVYWFRRVDTQDVVKDIMWSHPNSIKLLNSFPIRLIFDTTYKMNKYRLLLLEIVGVNSIGMTFFVAFAYLQSERVDNFEWPLSNVKGFFMNDGVMPQVIVIDKDLALMNELEIFFPSPTNFVIAYLLKGLKVHMQD